jgi:hypothetical protein
VDEANRWLAARFFGLAIDPEVWRRQIDDQFPPKSLGGSDYRAVIDWEATLSTWGRAGYEFDWDRDSKSPRTGFIHRNTLLDAEGRLLELRQHKPEPPD